MKRVIIIFFVVVIVYGIYYVFNESNYVKSDVDQNEYFVMERFDKLAAANTLARIKQNLIKLRNHLIIHQNEPKYIKYKSNINLMTNNITEINIRENNNPGKYTSYLVNKGDELVMCLRSGKDQHIHDMNILMFVAIHELAHACSDEYILDDNHTDTFSDLMAFLLQIAIGIGIYKYTDYNKNSIEYCGIDVNATPL